MYQTMYKLTLAACVFLVGCGGAPFVEADPASLSTDDAPSAQQHLPEDAGAVADSAPDVVGDRGDGGSVGEDAGVASAREAASDAAPKSDADADGGSAPVCLPTLSGVGTGDFRIAFTLTTTAAGDVALVSQRSGCDMTSAWWEVNMQGGDVGAATNAGSGEYASVGLSSTVNDGRPHRIVVGRTGGQLWYSIDSVRAAQVTPDAWALDTFPALAVGTDECPGYVSLDRSELTDLCVSSP